MHQILTVLSPELEAIRRSSVILIKGSQLMLVMCLVCPFKGLPNFSPVFASQIKMFLSIPPEAIVLPSGEKATKRTQPEWPSHVCSGDSVFKSHNLTVVSPEAEASLEPSGLKAH